jgi:hypothetical protein
MATNASSMVFQSMAPRVALPERLHSSYLHLGQFGPQDRPADGEAKLAIPIARRASSERRAPFARRDAAEKGIKLEVALERRPPLQSTGRPHLYIYMSYI